MRFGVALGCVMALVGCELVGNAGPRIKPRARPNALVVKPPVPRATSERSAALRSRLRAVQSSQLTNGLLRQDGGGPDTPFTADMLVRNFIQIAFYEEYDSEELAAGTAGRLKRWVKPIRMNVQFGASVPASLRAQDRQDVASYGARLSALTGHPIAMSGPTNFYVLFVGEDDRQETVDALIGRLPGLQADSLVALRNLSPDAYCAVATYSSRPGTDIYGSAVAVIRSENPDLLRLSCIHEELAQAMGLGNDSLGVRPSIFNDDDEFALLTTHDEMLLRMLYDARLRPGMTIAQARPILHIIANELLAGAA